MLYPILVQPFSDGLRVRVKLLDSKGKVTSNMVHRINYKCTAPGIEVILTNRKTLIVKSTKTNRFVNFSRFFRPEILNNLKEIKSVEDLIQCCDIHSIKNQKFKVLGEA